MGKRRKKGSFQSRLRRVLSPGDPLRLLAEELQAAPHDIHVVDFGNGVPQMVIPDSEPGLIPELLRRAREMDGHGDN